MKVYKFGGASVKNAEGVRNLRKIIDDEQNLFIIVSAMGKTTNALERVFGAVQKSDRAAAMAEITALREYHAAIIDDLWRGPGGWTPLRSCSPNSSGWLRRPSIGRRMPSCGTTRLWPSAS